MSDLLERQRHERARMEQRHFAEVEDTAMDFSDGD